MKFDYIIGNPPYQEDNKKDTSDKPIYNNFMDEAFKIGNIVELITPARFLFNAGKTPKAWNRKMLNDEHFKTLKYFPNSSDIFSNVDIKGGVVISLYNNYKKFNPIKLFFKDDHLRSIYFKVWDKEEQSLESLIYNSNSFRLSKKFHSDIPEAKNILSKDNPEVLATNIFQKFYNKTFFKNKPEDQFNYFKVFGRRNNTREYLWFREDYVNPPNNYHNFKIYYPKASGTGQYGEKSAESEIGLPQTGHTQSFISIGSFKTKEEAESLNKYLKTKFLRSLLGILKTTQDNQKSKWKYVPLQNFTEESDIDWDKTISEIDQQLYKKYGLNEEEIEFIETHVKAMD